ncbi:variant erythrocyte surface antigen-1 family protein [Babesia caballi]|uniref:Variant erythrocyte surface antigen-1 family protein n=1 Tax=Babesia caballi TaxID=5871 RepID=A0AAV4LP91_BABCB|nr:variant erythrocyte surface antigen-1 family protein [Babesia caballi]
MVQPTTYASHRVTMRLLHPPLPTSLSDRPSNLNEVIDWILRVTGKDGGSGDGNETKLAEAITKLDGFHDAIEAAAEKLQESGSGVSEALEKLKESGTLGEIIKKLADGLANFIGYGSQGKGIANVVDPLQQLRDGLVKFLYSFLGSVRTLSVDDNGATEKLRAAFSGRGGFEDAIRSMSNITDGKINGVVAALKKVGQLTRKSEVSDLAEEVTTYLTGVLEAVNTQATNQVDSLQSSLPALVKAYGEQTDDFATQMQKVENEYKQLNHRSSSTIKDVLTSAVYYGTESLIKQLKTEGYKSVFRSQNWNGTTANNKAAQIFLGCLPLYYYWLTYLYWKCRDKGGWEGNRPNSGAFGAFMSSHGYAKEHLKNQAGKQIAKTAFNGFTEITAQFQTSVSTYFEFFQKLRDSGIDKWKQGNLRSPLTAAQTHCLSGLYILTSTYFGHRQRLNSRESRPPTTIREMLYWLAGLQFSPNYNELPKEVKKHIPDGGLRVADSAKVTPSGSSGPGSPSTGDTLTRKDFNEYLTSTCVFAPALLGTIQGNAADAPEEPWLHSLFSNSQFNLSTPSSGAALFNTLANYAYALQFQLSFLYMQCVNGASDGFGWNQCTFGQTINTQNAGSAANVSSWICSSSACVKSNHCQHNSSSCTHFQQCGQSNKTSPLQAFLTDKLDGFHVSLQPTPDSPNHLHNHPPGFMCHVPMGFADKVRRDLGGGANIVYALTPFLGTSNNSLRQLSEKLSCLTKRTPRTLGDIFGFIWHLNGQLFKNKSPTLGGLIDKFDKAFGLGNNLKQTFSSDRYAVLTKIWNAISQIRSKPQGQSSTATALSLESMAPAIPFLYQLFMAEDSNSLPVVLFDLKQQCHKVEVRPGSQRLSATIVVQHNAAAPHKCSTSPADLFSLQTSRCTKGPNCGPYLYPLAHTTGSAFAPIHASSYLSWVLYLVDDLETELWVLRDELETITCKHSSLSHVSGCNCPSIVSCAGVLPLLYSNGFTFANAYSLKGGTEGREQTKRSCQQFHDQLTAVLANDENTPLFKLLTTIDDFLYMFRMYFFYNLSSFWILYTSYT